MTVDEATRLTGRFAEAVNGRDREGWVACFHPDFEGYSGPAASETDRLWQGLEGAGAWFDNLWEAYDTVEAHLDQTIVVGDHALQLIGMAYVGRATGLELEATLAPVIETREGRYLFVHSHLDLSTPFTRWRGGCQASPMAQTRKSRRKSAAVREAVAQAGAVPATPERAPKRGGDPFTGGLRRREVLPLLVLHFISAEDSYGNQLMERIADVTAGVLSVNPNTMYPLLRRLESQGLIEGHWEHPERRTRRLYSITDEGREEYARIREEVEPFLDSVQQSIGAIRREVFGK